MHAHGERNFQSRMKIKFRSFLNQDFLLNIHFHDPRINLEVPDSVTSPTARSSYFSLSFSLQGDWICVALFLSRFRLSLGAASAQLLGCSLLPFHRRSICEYRVTKGRGDENKAILLCFYLHLPALHPPPSPPPPLRSTSPPLSSLGHCSVASAGRHSTKREAQAASLERGPASRWRKGVRQGEGAAPRATLHSQRRDSTAPPPLLCCPPPVLIRTAGWNTDRASLSTVAVCVWIMMVGC